MRLAVYTACSVLATAFVVTSALATYPNYYTALISLSDSVSALCVLANMAIAVLVLAGRVVVWVFLDRIRDTELEDLRDRASILFFDSLMFWTGGGGLYTPLYPYDIVPTMLIMMFLFVLHWISADRLKMAFYEASPLPLMRLTRLGALIVLLFVADITLCRHFMSQFVYNNGKAQAVIPAVTPYLVDLVELGLGGVLRYGVNCYEAWYLSQNEDEDEWELKPLAGHVVDVMVSSFSLMMRCVTIWLFYTIVAQQFYKSIMSAWRIQKSIRELRKAQKAHSELDSLAALATEADIERDNVCVICREEMDAKDTNVRRQPRRLFCGHVIHCSCLKSWMSRSQLCPTCRQSVHNKENVFPQPAGPMENAPNENYREGALDGVQGPVGGIHHQPPNEGGDNIPRRAPAGPQSHQNEALPQSHAGAAELQTSQTQNQSNGTPNLHDDAQVAHETRRYTTTRQSPFEHDEDAALAAYLGGERRVMRFGNTWYEYRIV